jgi:menaquinone-specific isochorismate synthase
MAETAPGCLDKSALLTPPSLNLGRRLTRVNKTSVRTLVVETISLTDVPEILSLLPASNPLLWWRKGAGMVGLGHTLSLEFSGANRITDAAQTWHDIAAAAEVSDPLDIPGTGLIAFGTFTFSADSAMPSVLVIPRVVIGRRDGRGWITRIRFAEEAADTGMIPVIRAGSLPTAQAAAEALALSRSALPAIEHEASVTLSPGEQSEAGFLAAVDDAIARIRNNDVSKVVLARDLVGRLETEDDIRSTIVKLAQSYPDCWTYSVGGLIGSSPETLVSVHANRMDARVLAGTTHRGVDAVSDMESAAELASSTKDLDEHGFAVRSVVEALTPFTSHLTTSDGPFTLKLPNLWHLATDIAGSLTQGSTSLDLVQALHPTAAVAGTPTVKAMAVISELEPFDRGRYAGPVGWIGADGDGEWAIALRCAQVTGSTITAYAGCGIVAESVAETELNETFMKFRPVVDALA